MNLKITGTVVALCLLASGSVRADSGGIKNCIAQWTTSCSAGCATAQCVANCTTQAHDQCAKDIAAPQATFSGPVTATPVSCENPPVAACTPSLLITTDGSVGGVSANCSQISGTVANRAFWGGDVTIYVVCPPFTPAGHQNDITTTSVIGQAGSSCTDGTFTVTAANACGGQTGCYGLIAVTPASSCEACGTCGASTNTPGDPNWSTCTSTCCPAP